MSTSESLTVPTSFSALRASLLISWTQKLFGLIGSVLNAVKWHSPQTTPEQIDRRRALEIFREVLYPRLKEAIEWDSDRLCGPNTPIMSRDYSLLNEGDLQDCRAFRAEIRQSLEPLITTELGPVSRIFIAEFLLWLPWTWFPELSNEALSMLGITADRVSRRLALLHNPPMSLQVVKDKRDESDRLSSDGSIALWMLKRLYDLHGPSVIEWQKQLHDRAAHADDIEMAAGERDRLHYQTAGWADLLRERGPIERGIVAEFLLEMPAVLFPPLDNNLIKQLGISRKERALRLKTTKQRPYTYTDDDLLPR